MLVRLAYSLAPRRVQQVVLRLPEGATVQHALVALREQHGVGQPDVADTGNGNFHDVTSLTVLDVATGF